jgi:cytochrome c biogenesis protein CcdA
MDITLISYVSLPKLGDPVKRNLVTFVLVFLTILLIIVNASLGCSKTQIVVEFFYWNPSEDPNMCWSCSGWLWAYEDFQNKSRIVEEIENEYKNWISVQRIKWESNIGRPRNSIVINHEYVFFDNFTVTDVKEIIENYLSGGSPNPPVVPPLSLESAVVMAYVFGFFETFSPCLIVLLSFVLSYSVVETSGFVKKFLQISSFGLGFIIAAMIIFSVIVLGIVALSIIFGIQYILMWSVCIFAIIFGLDLIGFNLFRFFRKKVQSKPIVQDLAKKYAFSYFGLVLLGFLFYFLDPCIAPVFVTLISTFSPRIFIESLPLIIFAFSLGVLTPFVIIGFFAGSVSKITRGAYRHKAKIRAISGIILIGYAIYLILILLVPSLIR